MSGSLPHLRALLICLLARTAMAHLQPTSTAATCFGRPYRPRTAVQRDPVVTPLPTPAGGGYKWLCFIVLLGGIGLAVTADVYSADPLKTKEKHTDTVETESF